MPSPPPLGLDAIVRAVAALDPGGDVAGEQLADALRIRPSTSAESSGQGAALGREARSHSQSRSAPYRHRGEHLGRAPPRIIRLFPIPDLPKPDGGERSSGIGRWPLARTQTPLQAQATRPGDLLTPSSTARGFIKAMLSAPSAGGAVDYLEIVDTLGRGKPVLRIPMRPGRGLGVGATVLVDIGSWIDPFRADAEALIGALRNIVGVDRLVVFETANMPPTLDESEFAQCDESEPGFRPRPAVPLLILSDFGLNSGAGMPPRADSSEWARFAGGIARLGCEVIGLLPFAEWDWPPDLVRSMRLLHWAPDSTARTARRARERSGGPVWHARPPAGDVEYALSKLSAACSVASRIEPALLRSLRNQLLPGSSPSLESRIWWSDDIASRGVAAVTLRPEALNEHRDALRADRALAEAALDIRLSSGTPASPVLRLAEEIIRLIVLRDPGWNEAVAGKLNMLLRSLLDSANDPGQQEMEAARYVLAAIPDLSLSGLAEEARQDLIFLASHVLGTVPAGRNGQVTPSLWLREQLFGHFSERTEVSVSWNEQGLRLERSGDGSDVISVAGAPPALSMIWDPAGDATEWLDLKRPQLLHPPETDFVELRAYDGARWGLEDADAADSLPPLRLFVLMHPEDRDRRSEQFLDRLEASIRSFAGLPRSAPVLLRYIQIESWRDLPDWRNRPRLTGSISTWRGATTDAVATATGFVILVSKPLFQRDWTDEVAKMIADATRGDRPPPSIVLDWDGSGLADEYLGARGIDHLKARRSDLDDRGEADEVAKLLVQAWRRGFEAALHMERSKVSHRVPFGDWMPLALQGLGLAFHTRRFTPSAGYSSSEEPDPILWGLNGLADRPRSKAGDREVPLASPAADFRFVMAMAEYIYKGPVRDYLDGRDPFRPRFSVKEVAAAILGRGAEKREHRMPSIDLCYRSFKQFGGSASIAFQERFGERDLPSTEWRSGEAEEAATALRPWVTDFDEWRGGHKFSFCLSRTFPEFMEAFSGLLQHFLRNFALERPGTEVELNYPDWLQNRGAVRNAFPASFDYLNLRGGSGEWPKGSSSDSMPITEFADLCAHLSDLLAFQIRKAAGEYRQEHSESGVSASASTKKPPHFPPPIDQSLKGAPISGVRPPGREEFDRSE